MYDVNRGIRISELYVVCLTDRRFIVKLEENLYNNFYK